jgi:hypothetical protein
MKLSAVKNYLNKVNSVNFILPDKSKIPSHFHITEVGLVNKKFIDCGGTIREENAVSFQLWQANDFDHRLSPEKLLKIINISEKSLNIDDYDVEVEYQSDTIGRYALDFDGENFLLAAKFTDCLAKDNCGIPKEKSKLNLADIDKTNACAPGGSCC